MCVSSVLMFLFDCYLLMLRSVATLTVWLLIRKVCVVTRVCNCLVTVAVLLVLWFGRISMNLLLLQCVSNLLVFTIVRYCLMSLCRYLLFVVRLNRLPTCPKRLTLRNMMSSGWFGVRELGISCLSCRRSV